MLLGFLLFVLGCCGLVRGGTGLESVNVCQCGKSENGAVICLVTRGSVLTAKGCDEQSEILRVTGPGFVVSVDEDVVTNFKMLVLERTTLSCQDIRGRAEIILNNAVCVSEQGKMTTTTTTTRMPTNEPKPRPPAQPVDDDENGDDDGDDDNNESSTITTTNATTTTTVVTTSPMTTTLTKITVTATAAFREWWIIVGVAILITSVGVVVIIKVRCQRSRSHQPVQVQEVSSTGPEPQRTYVLRKTPRSPRRRRSDSMESVVLYAVEEDML